uniref:Tetratricopeptide repeat domain 12 n=1 Tax=Oreochromis niloticus TaxID=8128 RepID=A0A669E095_ORENI
MHHRRLFSDRGSCTYCCGITYFLFFLLYSLLFSFAEYLTQVDLEKEKETQEIKAKEEFDKGERKATTVVELLEKLSKPGQIALYYCGGLEILSQALTDCTGQTLFRLNNGFSIITSNVTVRSCLLEKTNDPESRELCVSVLKLWRRVCCGNDENQKLLMTCPVATQSIVHLASSEHDEVAKECLALLSVYSEIPRGRHLAIESLDLNMLVRNLMVCVSKPKKQQENTAVSILQNFATESRFCIQLRNVLTDSVILPVTTILKNVNTSNQHILPSLISGLGCLARDDVIRHKLAHDPECWKAFLVAVRTCIASEYREILYPLLGLIMNLSTVTSPVVQRATGVLSAVLPQSPQAVQHVIQREMVKTMCRLLEGTGQTATKYAIKTLTVCTAASHLAREKLVNSDKKLSILRCLLSSSCDEMVSGNAALCLAHCLDLEGVASDLLGTDIVLLLLRHAAGDAKRTAVQQNAAIALGKLCRCEPRHTSKLRELHGLEILHSCVKLIS